MTKHTLVLAIVLIAVTAGCMGTGQDMSGMNHGASTLDTGNIAPGESRALTFAVAGAVAIHCHPHPFMQQNVTVTNSAAAPVHVHIVDGAETSLYGFEPSDLSLGRGSVVTYHNHGNQTHTATNAMENM